jgi:hypothetical protein
LDIWKILGILMGGALILGGIIGVIFYLLQPKHTNSRPLIVSIMIGMTGATMGLGMNVAVATNLQNYLLTPSSFLFAIAGAILLSLIVGIIPQKDVAEDK